jgi:hypothetical protein
MPHSVGPPAFSMSGQVSDLTYPVGHGREMFTYSV